jgi:hypothetical protein
MTHGATIRRLDPETGEVVTRRVRHPEARFVAYESEHGGSVRDRGEHAFYATETRAIELARWLNTLDPTPEQLAAFLGEREHRRFLRRLGLGTRVGLRYPSVCLRCGRPMSRGMPAFWHTESKLVRHVRSCPEPAPRRRAE